MRGGSLTVQGLAVEPHIDRVRGLTAIIRAEWGPLELYNQQEDPYVISDITMAKQVPCCAKKHERNAGCAIQR